MDTAINYEKYENMDRRTIFNQLLKAEEKLTKLEKDFKTKITIQKELVKFLRAKTKSKIDEPKFYSLSEAPSIKKLDAEFEKLSKHEQEALI
ncbi:formate dehydrogenase, partial [Campylobacter ureolyticus]|uniref:formate dehydrogenase n=2 Tax=Campylobacter ureolyticus TaxID=827 RepID=UPI0012EC4D70